jgi:hypothetical protein
MRGRINFTITFKYANTTKIDIVDKKFENMYDAEQWAKKEARKRGAKEYWVN